MRRNSSCCSARDFWRAAIDLSLPAGELGLAPREVRARRVERPLHLLEVVAVRLELLAVRLQLLPADVELRLRILDLLDLRLHGRGEVHGAGRGDRWVGHRTFPG